MLTIACVQVDNYCDRGAEYVAKLFAGVVRNLTCEWKGVCLTDDPSTVPDGIEVINPPDGISGWFNKLALFHPDAFKPGTRVIYFDLDTVFVSSLDDMAGYSGRFAAMNNILGREGIASGVMAWEAGRVNNIWEQWEANWRPLSPGGDQQWIQFVERNCDRLNRLYPGQLVSYKADVQRLGSVPDSARAVFFHGLPRPHEVDADWMKDHWRNPSV